jgi:predicted O-linked N-acetylglucosamine transferase (SPINDLY family)
MVMVSEALAIAIQHHQAGRLQAAEQIYRQILAVEPAHPDAMHLLGVLAFQAGKHELAVQTIGQAIRWKGTEPAFHNNLGEAYRALHRLSEALDCYRRAIELDPNFAEAHNSLGVAFSEQAKWEEAAACYRRALQLRPDYAEAHNNLGIALKEQGHAEAAIASYRRALELRPGYAEAHNNLGAAWNDQGNHDAAIACFRRALEQRPDLAEFHNSLGVALKEQGKRDAAIACYRRTLELKPDYAEAHNNLGIALGDQEKRDAAIACYRRAVELNPNHGAALGSLVHELQHLCAWEELPRLSQRLTQLLDEDPPNPLVSPPAPFVVLALSTPTTALQQLRSAQRWTERKFKTGAARDCSAAFRQRSHRKPTTSVGYLSADFHAHATAWLIAELIEKHDRRRVTVCGYSYGPDDRSPMRRRLVEAFDRFVDLRDVSFPEAARRIAADEVDILVDLKGHTQNARTEILALRPAPIQVNYLGYPGTMGTPLLDYILVDDFIVPAEQQPFFAERLVHLPGCYQVNDSRREISAHTPSRTECGLPDEGFVFCSFNNSYKITPEIFAVWMRLLRAVPGSVFWLLEGNRFAVPNLLREAQRQGIAPERLVFAPRRPLPEHLARHRLADLFLDTFPVNAHTTASDALWAGCPLLTLAGETFASRVAGSLLRAVGLPELITTRLADYEALALSLARNPRQLGALRARLNANRNCALFDAGQFARNLEQAYATMADIHARGQAPQAFRVEAGIPA